MLKWASAAAGLILAAGMLLATFRIRRRQRSNRTLNEDGLNQWFRRHR